MLWDYIVVGAGLTGSVVTNRLLAENPDLNILVVEAGKDANNQQDIVWPNATNGAGGEFDWNYASTPQTHLDHRVIPSNSGKGLGGGTLINGAAWVRGHHVDYDLWGEAVDDKRWTYEGLLPYFRQTEDFFTKNTELHQHGEEGNMHIQSISSLDRWFPMRKPLIESWNVFGVEPLPKFDHNRGNPLGMGEMQENRNIGRRQQSSKVYPLDGATVVTETMVTEILIWNIVWEAEKAKRGEEKSFPGFPGWGPPGWGNPGHGHGHGHGNGYDNGDANIAIGVKLANGTSIFAKETILAGGAYRTPQLLMLSGIGPKKELEKHNIDVLLDQPHVGQNLFDHAQIVTPFSLQNASEGWAVESRNPLYDDPKYSLGLNLDFMVGTDVPKDGLAKAIAEQDGHQPDPKTHPLLNQNRTFSSHTIQYSGASDDGSAILSMTVLLIDQSRGSITLNSSSIKDDPVIDTGFLSSPVDRYALRELIRQDLNLLLSDKTKVGKDIIKGHLADKPLTLDSTDDEIDAFIRQTATGIFHPGGTAAMGKVVDTDLRVKGVNGLRIVDTSILPHTISANLQVCMYGVAHQAADIIGGAWKR